MTSLLSVLDSAALMLSLAPEDAPTVQARLCLRGGFQCFGRIARAMGFDVPLEANPDAGITLTFEEFLDAVTRMDEVGFPMTRDPADAWPDFVGWRVNYEQSGLPDRGGHRRGARAVVGTSPPHGGTDSADPAAPRPAARLDSPEHVNDLSLIPWLCWGA